jgi:large subunit ribosomal protein L10
MPREKEVKEHKVKIVKKVTESLKKSKVVVLTSYSGMKTADLTALRRKLRTAGVEYHVIKNTLARFAARDAAKGFSQDAFNGPLAAAFGYEDPVMTAKLLVDYARNADISLSIVGGILGEQLLNRMKSRS